MTRYTNNIQVAQKTRDFYKGKSFYIHGEWLPEQHYFDDDYITSWVTYNGALLYCKKNHISSLSNRPILIHDSEGSISGMEPNEFWELALSASFTNASIKGEKGDRGDKGEPGNSGCFAVHVGPENPVVFKNKITDPTLKAAYEHADKMMWVDTTDNYEHSYIDTVYAAYKEAGGNLTLTEFKGVFSTLGLGTSSFTTRSTAVKAVYDLENFDVHTSYDHRAKSLSFTIQGFDSSKFYYILVRSRNPKHPSKWALRNGAVGSTSNNKFKGWVANSQKEFYSKNSFEGFPIRMYTNKYSLQLPLLINEEFRTLGEVLRNKHVQFTGNDGVYWFDSEKWPESTWNKVLNKVLISTRSQKFYKSGYYVKNPIQLNFTCDGVNAKFVIDLTTRNYFKQIIKRDYQICVAEFDEALREDIAITEQMDINNPHYIKHTLSDWETFQLTLRSSKLKEDENEPTVYVKQL